MSSNEPKRSAMAQLFREIVLVLGGVFAVHGTDTEMVEQVARGLESVYRRASHAHQEKSTPRCRLSPHPAIAKLLHLADHTEKEK